MESLVEKRNFHKTVSNFFFPWFSESDMSLDILTTLEFVSSILFTVFNTGVVYSNTKTVFTSENFTLRWGTE